ncbi:dTDP-4-amino-4,6-dideoxygalactose transaminase [Treponema brennaborense]|uniref:TDP-4-keto-6-deoxy-D-glucose transaminase n=1 Tax=Treponema brennaborense (strain DSM 12168 / CIP 105900 / DD5/3) TaxID=906968 RepID=F4LMH9_TREBD|nr:dTDP-4-amino-4,6-dideoxygalactose transaminase [Treponema brennaborense]AEE15741.1 TDP-4-keto-6-deoxy-D-glucose transaminase [Treponema brennaborense DSM 12168]
MIHFNVPPCTGNEITYIQKAIENHKICGDGEFTKKCSGFLENKLDNHKVLLTTSGTAALEMAAVLCDVKPGDEVIMPSYTFCSTADAFVQRGATIVFVDIRPDTMNIDEKKIEEAVTSKTKVIVPVHYAGVACEMDAIMDIAGRYNLKVVEDAAQAIMSVYKGKPLGTIGDFGCLSFHETKNFSMGEGGAVVINHEKDFERAEILREKGTNRSKFFRGQIDKYTWVDYGSSYLPSDLNAAYLWAQLELAERIQNQRMTIWNTYQSELYAVAERNELELPTIPDNCVHNAHMYYLKFPCQEQRADFINFMKSNDILTVFHYIPLHSAPAGMKFGRFAGTDEHTTKESERLVRLPLYYGLTSAEQMKIIDKIKEFFL